MSDAITIACAPCCWGVDDVTNPNLPPWECVFDEAAAAGFAGLELGPYGYMPLDAPRMGLCLDTGHVDYSGMVPVATLRRHADRLDYVHVKDIDPAKYAEVMSRRIRFFKACAEGVMCPIGRGRIGYPALRRLLTEIGYGGYVTIEQERDPRNAGGSLADLTASRDFLRRHGF